MRLKDIRNSKNLTQVQLAIKSGVNIRSIRAYEQGKKNINKAAGIILYKLSKALDCTIEDLLELDRTNVD